MTLNPPLRHNDVEVTSFDPQQHIIHAVVYVKAFSPLQVNTPEMVSIIQQKINNVIRYMEMEGYIIYKGLWAIQAGIVVSTP
jgi:hypothetical protein